MKKTATITFPDWIRAYGATKLAQELRLKSASAVHKWKARTHQPSLDHAAAILTLAKGQLKAEDLKKAGAR